jgi:hypothetical protein
VAADREDRDPGREREPERDREREQPQPPEDHEPAADDHDECDDHPRVHRAPPEVERLGALRPEDQEAEDEPEVRRVKDVPPL